MLTTYSRTQTHVKRLVQDTHNLRYFTSTSAYLAYGRKPPSLFPPQPLSLIPVAWFRSLWLGPFFDRLSITVAKRACCCVRGTTNYPEQHPAQSINTSTNCTPSNLGDADLGVSREVGEVIHQVQPRLHVPPDARGDRTALLPRIIVFRRSSISRFLLQRHGSARRFFFPKAVQCRLVRGLSHRQHCSVGCKRGNTSSVMSETVMGHGFA